MTPRPFAAHKQRPSSAIFIGSIGSSVAPTVASPPELPEPPSPGASSNGSGLPSPPATNSTGSGSIGDDSFTDGSVRKKSLAYRPHSASEMVNGTYDRSPYNIRDKLRSGDDDEDLNDNENDEDNTARFALDKRRSAPAAPEDNISALQRVKSLTQRNRMVLDKLTSISRLGSPVPSKSRSPFSPANNRSPSSASNSSSHRPSSRSQSQAGAHLSAKSQYYDNGHSGSETERESQHPSAHSYSSSESLSATPTSSISELRPTDFVRPRRLSAPSSPAKVRNQELAESRDRQPSPGPSRAPKKRVSMALSAPDERYDYQDEDEPDVTAAALAAVASSRGNHSPPVTTNGGSRRSRQPLPREFRERDRRSLDGKTSEPSTPHRHRDRERTMTQGGRRSPSPTPVHTSPRRPGAARFSTVRELTRKHQTRWLSEDLSAPIDEDEDANRSHDSIGGYGRRQSRRPISSESPVGLPPGRSLLGEGLRAAGLSKRKDAGEDVFINGNGNGNGNGTSRHTRSTGPHSVASGDWDASTRGGPPHGRVEEAIGPPSTRVSDGRTSQRQLERTPYTSLSIRPGTSMAALHHDSPDHIPPRTAPAALRTYRSTYSLDREAPSSQQVGDDRPGTGSHDRSYYSPYTTTRPLTTPLPAAATSGSAHDPHTEHRRLMLEALTMFESHLSRLPPMGQTTTTTVPDVFQNAQHLVHSMDKLNSMLKKSTNRALESQIEAEVADYPGGINMSDLWSRIGAEHRDNLRMSDEVVRTMTALLLGIGKVLRDTTSVNVQQHLRAVSLDEEITRRGTPDVSLSGGDRRSSDGRSSRDNRHSWDVREPREPLQGLTRMASRERNITSRPGSSLNMLRSATTSSSEDRSMDPPSDGGSHALRHVASALLPSSTTRRLYAPRESRMTPDLTHRSFDSQGSMEEHDPSPTPAPRQQVHTDRNRALPPLAIPPPLSTLPSESLLRRSATSAVDRNNRRKISSNSNITVRPEPPPSAFPPVLKPANVTTAVTTHTVSNQSDAGPANQPRADSVSSTRGVTFSRPSTISVSTLSGLQQQHDPYNRNRTISTNSTSEEPSPLSASVRSPMSGSETERPRTVAFRGRVSLDGKGEAGVAGGNAYQASTLASSRKERRRTITEIFTQR